MQSTGCTPLKMQGLSKMANAGLTEFLSEHAADAGFLRGKSGTLGAQSTDLLSGYPSKSNDALVELAQIAKSIREDDELSALVLTTPAKASHGSAGNQREGYFDRHCKLSGQVWAADLHPGFC